MWPSPTPDLFLNLRHFQVRGKVNKAVFCRRGVAMGPHLAAGSHLSRDNVLGTLSPSPGKELKIWEGVRKEYPAGSRAGNDSLTSHFSARFSRTVCCQH